MKKRSGFTLVELLAVIAILAIIMLLIVPNIVKLFQNGRKDAFIRQVQSIWREAEKDYAAFLTYGEEYVLFCDKDRSSLGCSTLNVNETDVAYYVSVNESGNVNEVSVSDGNFCYSKVLPSINIDRSELVEGNISCDANNSKVCECVPRSETPKVTNKVPGTASTDTNNDNNENTGSGNVDDDPLGLNE